ncbi:MAG: PEP/pyruvate-binding domain-containing protein [Nanoarchaeota archaeon]
MDNILWLSEVTSNDINLIGNKAFRLSELYQLRLPIPQGFIITKNVFKKFLEYNNLGKQIYFLLHNLDTNNFKLLQSKVHEINEIIMKAEFSENMKNEIMEAYDNMNVSEDGWGGGNKNALDLIRVRRSLPYVAIRSSTILDEYDRVNYLNIKGISSLITVIKKVYSSLFSFDNIYYRARNNIMHEDSSIAVVVQKMINSEKSGFILNDVEENLVNIQAIFGMGDLLLNKAVNPDLYVLDINKFEIVERNVNSQEYYLTRDDFGNNVRKNLDKKDYTLNDAEINTLSSYYKKLSDYYKKKIKMEFAVENSMIYVIDLKEGL